MKIDYEWKAIEALLIADAIRHAGITKAEQVDVKVSRTTAGYQIEIRRPGEFAPLPEPQPPAPDESKPVPFVYHKSIG